MKYTLLEKIIILIAVISYIFTYMVFVEFSDNTAAKIISVGMCISFMITLIVLEAKKKKPEHYRRNIIIGIVIAIIICGGALTFIHNNQPEYENLIEHSIRLSHIVVDL